MMDDRVELLLLNERVQTVIRTVLAHNDQNNIMFGITT
jgi:hypothetical protein